MKAKLTLTATMTYKINPKSYPKECDDYQKMLQLDIQSFQDNPYLFLDSVETVEIKGELLIDSE